MVSGFSSQNKLDCTLIFVPKLRHFYKPIGEHMFTVILPMGLMSVADFISKAGFKTQILHFGLEKTNNRKFSLKEYLETKKPAVIGLSLHWHYQTYDTMEVVKEIRRLDRNVFIVLGGLTAGFFHSEIMNEFDCIDGVIRGDGEYPLLQLLKNISSGEKDLSNIPNLTWRQAGKIRINEVAYVMQGRDLDRLDFTNFNLLNNYQLYIKSQDMRGGRWLKGKKRGMSRRTGPSYFPLLIHKGCYFNCSYCGGSNLSQKLTSGRYCISIRSIERVVDSVKKAQEFGYKEIYISYLPFATDKEYFERLFEVIKKENVMMNYHLECWALPEKKMISRLKETCLDPSKSYICISPESGNERVRSLNKGYYYSNDELIETVGMVVSSGFSVILYFSIGLPFETMEEAKDSILFQRKLKKIFGHSITISTVNPVMEPASPMFLEPEKYRVIKTRFSFKDFINSSKDINAAGFITSELGYFKRDFGICDGRLPEEEAFREKLQGIICTTSCRLADYVFLKLPVLDQTPARSVVMSASRLVCNVLHFFSRCGYFLRSKGRAA